MSESFIGVFPLNQDGKDAPQQQIAPTLTSLTPATIDISTGDLQTVTIAGSDFQVDSVVVINGSDDIGQYVSATEMTFDVNTYTASGPGTIQVSVRNDVEVSNELPLELVGIPIQGDPNHIPDTPPTGASPNTEAIRAEYHAPEPPDVYQQAVPAQFTEPTATGEPRPHTPEPDELPTTNAYDNGDGGLPSNPREPYPTMEQANGTV